MCISKYCHNRVLYWVYTDPYCFINSIQENITPAARPKGESTVQILPYQEGKYWKWWNIAWGLGKSLRICPLDFPCAWAIFHGISPSSHSTDTVEYRKCDCAWPGRAWSRRWGPSPGRRAAGGRAPRAAWGSGNLLYYRLLHCTLLYCTVLYYTVLYCTLLYSNEPFYTPPIERTAMNNNKDSLSHASKMGICVQIVV